MLSTLSGTLRNTREGHVVISSSFIYLTVWVLTIFIPSVARFSGIVGAMAPIMPIVMIVGLLKLGGHKQDFDSGWLSTCMLASLALIPVLVALKFAFWP